MSQALLPPFTALAALLLASGAMKLSAPVAATGAIAALGGPSSAHLARLLAAAEIGLGAGALALGGRLSALALVLCYGGFAVALTRLRRRRAGCGCFGEDHRSPHAIQVVVNLAATFVAAAATVWPVPDPASLIARPSPTTLAVALGSAACAYGAYLVHTALPGAWTAPQPRPQEPR